LLQKKIFSGVHNIVWGDGHGNSNVMGFENDI